MSDHLQAHRKRLEGLLSASPARLRAAVRTRYEAAVVGGERFVLFGAGNLGRRILRGLRAAGVEPLAFADNRPQLQGQVVDGLSVLAPVEAFLRYRNTAAFVPTVFTHSSLGNQLIDADLRVIPVPVLLWQYPQTFLPFVSLTLPEAILEARESILEGLEIWHEESSREEYLAQIAWRTTLDPAVLPAHLPQDQIYFPVELFDLGPKEVVVDCGAFDGDTLRALLKRTSGYARYYAVEPDSDNRSRLSASLRDLDPVLASHCTILPYAVGNHSGTTRFLETGTASSVVSDAGDQEISMERLDNLLQKATPTFIKMDIEGAEQDALQGGRETIQRCRPILAICLYHRPDDLWKVPQIIKEIIPDYRFYLRRYCDDLWEQVCYAVPPRRSKEHV